MEAVCSAGLLLPHHTLQVFRCHCEEAAQLLYALVGDVTGRVGCDGLIQKFLGLLVIGLCYVQGVFKRGFMFQRRFVFHDPILVRFPG